MQNPYEVLGVREGASKDEIKAAYRELVKKYHPDRHQDNPLYELAEEKLREINEAYEYLMNDGGSSSVGYGANSASSAYNPQFAEIRRTLDANNLQAAEILLNRNRDMSAEWHFLNGVLCLKKGWYDEGVNNIQQAVRMDPQNAEYQNVLAQVSGYGRGYQTASYNRGYTDAQDQACRMCQCLCCVDMLTDC
ncbi:MAG: J domain-containing protein [Clostridiales bacterium]|nr:J domain-containing protein [Clostridiales bacterium]